MNKFLFVVHSEDTIMAGYMCCGSTNWTY